MRFLNQNNLRRNILESLYYLYRTYGATRFRKNDFESFLFERMSDITDSDLLGSLNYLKDKDYITFTPEVIDSDLAQYSIELRATGIDLIEDESEFNQKFSDSKTIQIAIGDNIQLAGRDNNITMVHDIIQKAAIDEQFKSELMELVTQINNSKSHEEKKSLIKKFSDSLISSSPSLIFQIMSAIWFQ